MIINQVECNKCGECCKHGGACTFRGASWNPNHSPMDFDFEGICELLDPMTNECTVMQAVIAQQIDHPDYKITLRETMGVIGLCDFVELKIEKAKA